MLQSIFGGIIGCLTWCLSAQFDLHKSSAGNTQLVLTHCHKEVVFWFSGIFIQVVSRASHCFLVTVADTLHHCYLLPPCQKALLCLAWYKEDTDSPGKFAVCILRRKKWVILGYVTYHPRVLNEWLKKACFSSLTTEGFCSDELCWRTHTAGSEGRWMSPRVSVMSPDRMSSHTAACIPNNFIYMSCLHVFKRRQLQTTCQGMTVGRVKIYKVVLWKWEGVSMECLGFLSNSECQHEL